MVHPAELFEPAERMLVEVIGRIRGGDWSLVVPPVLDVPGADAPASLRELVARQAHDDARLPALLAGRPADPDGLDSDQLGTDLLDDPHGTIARLADAACAAVRDLRDPDAVVHTADGDVPAADLLWRATMTRSFLAHDIAMALGSRACPLPEDLARGLLEGTGPRAAHWRAAGYFREPLPYPPGHVSWRDQFLLTAGRDPHPFLH